MSYGYNTMWMDVIIIFPLVVYGLEKLINDNNGIYYSCVLGLSIFLNYYLSIMVCVFCVLYFFVLIMENRIGNKRKIIKLCSSFALHSLLAGMIAAVIVVPNVFILLNTKSAEFVKKLYDMPNIFQVISMHLNPITRYIKRDEPVNIYCTITVFVLYILFVKKYYTRYKYRILLMFLMIISCCSVSLSYIWNGFNYPRGINGRFMFMYVFMVTQCAYIYFNYVLRNKKTVINNFILKIIAAGCITCSLFGMKYISYENIAHTKYYSLYKEIQNDKISDYRKLELRHDFYTEIVNSKNSASIFTSTLNRHLSMFLNKNLGFVTKSSYLFESYKPLLSDIMNVQYADEAIDNKKLSIAFVVNDEYENYKSTSINAFINAITSSSDKILLNDIQVNKVHGSESLKHYKINILDDGYYFLNNVCNRITLTINGKTETFLFLTQKTNGIVCLGYFKSGDDVEVICSNFDGEPLYEEYLRFSRMDDVACEKVIAELKSNPQMVDVVYKDNTLSGKITLKEPGVVFTSIPYEKGWKAWDNGKEITVYNKEKALVYFKLDDGKHNIYMEYKTYGFTAGLCMSLIGILTVIAIYIRIKRQERYM